MARIRQALAAIADALKLNRPLLKRAVRRYKRQRRRAYRNYLGMLRSRQRADRLRAQGRSAVAEDRRAARRQYRHRKSHDRAQWWLGKIKRYQQRIHKLQTRQADLEAESKRLSEVKIVGNSATGGTKRQRLRAVALASAAGCASGTRPNFYSQTGPYDVDHCITGEAPDHRSDCSSWFASVYRSAGLADPSGQRYTAGWTGTLVENGEQIDRPEVGCAVIYGSGPGHHVEMYVGPGDKTIGHGSAPIDPGVIDLFGDGGYRFFKFI